MPPKMTHSQCCEVVCLICGNEAGRGDRRISQAEIPLIKEYVLPGYDPQDDRFINKHNFPVCNLLYAGFHRPLVPLAERGSRPLTLWSSPPCTHLTCAASRPELRQPVETKTAFAVFARGLGCLVGHGMHSRRK